MICSCFARLNLVIKTLNKDLVAFLHGSVRRLCELLSRLGRVCVLGVLIHNPGWDSVQGHCCAIENLFTPPPVIKAFVFCILYFGY